MRELQTQNLSRRQFLQIAGLGSATLALAACVAPGGAPVPAAEGGNNTATSENVVLHLQVNEEDEKSVAGMFKDKHNNVEFEFITVTGIDHEEVASKILAMLAAGQPLDLGYAATEATQLYAGQELAAKLDDWIIRDGGELQEYFDDVHPSLVEAMMWQGSLYQLPFDFNAANMYYNTALFKEAGFEHPAPDWSKDDFYAIAQAITKKNAAGETEIFGFGWTNRLWGSWTPWYFVNGGNILVEEQYPGGDWLWDAHYKDDPAAADRGGGWNWPGPKANSPEVVEALEFVQQLTQEGIAPAIELGGGSSLEGFFQSGKLGMIPAGGFWTGGLHNAGMAPDAFDVQLWPKWKSQRHQFGTANFFVVNTQNSTSMDLGWEYIKHRIQKESMEAHAWFNPVTRTTPARRSMNTAERYSLTGPAHWEVFYNTLDEHPDTAPIPAPPVSNPMTTAYTKYTGLAMSGEMTAQEAMDGLQKELEEIFARGV
ncbi:MAG: substrate-binding domain-containing protein [Caldilineaceae bacterium]